MLKNSRQSWLRACHIFIVSLRQWGHHFQLGNTMSIRWPRFVAVHCGILYRASIPAFKKADSLIIILTTELESLLRRTQVQDHDADD